MRTSRRADLFRAVVVGIVSALVALPPSLVRAQAQPEAAAQDPMAQGRAEFDKGRIEFDLGHYDQALAHFEMSYRLTRKTALLYNLGFVNKSLFERTRKLEYLEQALDRFKSFIASTPAGDAQRVRAESALKDAENEYAKELARRAQGEGFLKIGEQFAQQKRWDEAAVQLEQYERTPNNERSGVVRAYLLRAAIAVGKNDQAAASDAYAKALSLDRGAIIPPDATPAMSRAFAEGRTILGSAQVVAVSHTAPGSFKLNQAIELTFTKASDPLNLIAGVDLYYRSGSGAFSRITGNALGKVALPRVFSASLPAGAKVEYYAEVRDRNAAILEHLGSSALPFATQIDQPLSKSVAKKWWFWTIIVAVAAGAAVGLGVGLRETPPTRINGTFGTTQTLIQSP